MDGHRFDDLTKEMVGTLDSRRAVARWMAGGALGLVAARSGPVAAATCRATGAACRKDGQCCSRRCRGSRSKGTCAGGGGGTCARGQSFCVQGSAATCDAALGCVCVTTTGGTSFCMGAGFGPTCEDDADCAAGGFPPGSVCARRDGPRCELERETFCVKPCGA